MDNFNRLNTNSHSDQEIARIFANLFVLLLQYMVLDIRFNYVGFIRKIKSWKDTFPSSISSYRLNYNVYRNFPIASY